jgi:hypothetical protein
MPRGSSARAWMCKSRWKFGLDVQIQVEKDIAERSQVSYDKGFWQWFTALSVAGQSRIISATTET